jgi:hypothetical protein
MLDEALYNLMMETQAAIFAAASVGTASTGEVSESPPALLQINAGRAESPGWFLVQATEFDPEPLTVADLRIRDVYGAPRIVQALLDLMAGARWLEHDGADSYALADAGRAILLRSRRRRQTLVGLLPPLPSAAVEELGALLGRVIAASLEAPTPPGVWCLAHSRRRAPEADAPIMAHILHYFDDINAFRDDAHMAAWRPYDLEGYVWEAFALVVRGEARTADDLFARLAHRGYRRTEYAGALEILAQRGRLILDASSGSAQSTAEGRAVHAAVERDTDRYFYGPWACLSADESARLQALLVLVRDSLGAEAEG